MALLIALGGYVLMSPTRDKDATTNPAKNSISVKGEEKLPEEALPYVSDVSFTLCRTWNEISRSMKSGGQSPPSPKWHPDAVHRELKRRHPRWDWTKIEAGEVAIGMDETEVVCAWGSPNRRHETNIRGRTQEQWVYRDKDRYLYFEHGLLYGWN